MRLNKYINESRTQKITEEEAEEFISEYCQQSLKSIPIYRGISDYKQDYYFLRPQNFPERTSPYATHNYYNLLLSNLPSWKNYPPRNKSIICTTDFHAASVRGKGFPYVVLPKDGSKIGMCPNDDIWWSFGESFYSLNDFNKVIEEIFWRNIYKNKKISFPINVDAVYDTFVKACNMIDKLKKEGNLDIDLSGRFSISFTHFIEPYQNGNMTFLELIDDALSPDKNKFKLLTIGDNLKTNREVWTDGDSVLLRFNAKLITKFGIRLA